MLDIAPMKIVKSNSSRIKELDLSDLTYGKIYSDHMMVADYINGKWSEVEIVPFQKLELSPSISALHYGQSIFEGLKVFKGEDGKARLFRHMENFNRMNVSAERMGMPHIPEYFFSEALPELIRLDEQWIPSLEGSSLYIRPLLFATDEKIGVHISSSYKFVVFTTPVGQYYPHPIKAYVETDFTRACLGGVGFAKAAGNYGAAMYPTKLAKEKGYDQIIWTDSEEHNYIEEAGTMNIMAVIGNKLVTPKLSNTTLAGITRDTIITLARDKGITVEERKISVNELIENLEKGELKELFGVGTAATVTHLSGFGYKDHDYKLPEINEKLLSTVLKKELNNIRLGLTKDLHNWITII